MHNPLVIDFFHAILTTVQELITRFKSEFGASPLVVRSPGRINLLGEHTDYNLGFVLPAAIDKYAYVAVAPAADNRIRLVAADLNDRFEGALDNLAPVEKNWCNYILGVTHQFLAHRLPAGGFNLVLSSDIPAGAGLSSSAALSSATAFALNELWGTKVNRLQLARFAQAAEHLFAGVQCGIMDQFASLFGKADHAMLLDCRTMEYRYIPLQLSGYEFVLLDSGVKHSLASSAYNQRRAECEEGISLIARQYPQVKSLRDATIAQVDECLMRHEIIYKRCRYVLEENVRVQQACDALLWGDWGAFGRKMTQTHMGLQHQYEVICAETDFLVARANSMQGVVGARMMGGGFGGCTLNLVRTDAVERFVSQITNDYVQLTGRRPLPYRVNIANGTEAL